MRNYILRRALLVPITVLGVSLLVSLTMELLPGNVADIIVAESGGFGTDITQDKVEQELGLDKNVFVRWFNWLTDVAQGDFGEYFRGGRSVGVELENRLPVTLQLSAMALVISLFISLPIGIISAVRQDSLVDYVARSLAIFMLAAPSFWLGVMFFVLVGENWPTLLPPIQYKDFWEDPSSNLQSMWAPAVILAFALAGSVMRLTRSQMLEVLRQDYVRTAWSKGLKERVVVTRHAVRNAFIPVISLIGVQVNILISGSIVLEVIFGLPGIGRMIVTDIQTREYLAVQGVLLVVATMIVVVNFLVDLSYSLLDPRIRYN
ncbi:MAG TPA: ABC transporter permease [Dehalococcoidia bacterium]|nr:ABC transporter permease [Dehalococcoidia bacterium]